MTKSASETSKAAAKTDPEIVVALKGFDADLTCRGYSFKIGQTYEASGPIRACHNGFHAVEKNPFEVWSYYGPVDDDGRLSRYALVEQSGDLGRHSEDSKVASRLLTLKIELSLGEFLQRAVAWVIDATKLAIKPIEVSASVALNDDGGYSAQIGSSGDSAQIGSSGDSAKIGSSGYSAKIGSSGYNAKIGSSGDSAQIGSSGDNAKIGSSGDSAQIGSSGNSAQIGSSGNSAKIGSSGDSAKIGSSGYNAKIGSSGDSAQIGSSGDSAKIGSSGDSAQIGSSGYSAKIGSSGDSAQIGSSGDSAKIGSSGYSAKIGSSGNSAQIGSSGKDAVIASAGLDTWSKGAAGTWMALAEFDDTGKCVGFATGHIGDGDLEPDVYYRAKGGKLVRAK